MEEEQLYPTATHNETAVQQAATIAAHMGTSQERDLLIAAVTRLTHQHAETYKKYPLEKLKTIISGDSTSETTS